MTLDSMTFGRLLRRKLRAAVPPMLFLSLVAYFAWNASQGDRGLEAAARRQDDLRAALADQARAEQELAVWERRVAGLQSRLDTDALDERSRAMLNLSDPNDVIVPYDKGQKLF